MVLGKLGTTLIPEMAMDPLISQHEELAAVHLNEPGPHRLYLSAQLYAHIK
jgi:LysR family hydrogen peroxide-inducible transcriptional activator